MTISPSQTDAASSRRAWILLGVLWTAIFVLRLLGPPNLLDQDQQRPASYVLDTVQNGNWICQRDYLNDITSKPPLWTWFSAVITMVCGRINLFALYLPGAAAMAGTMALLFITGKKYFGFRTGVFAAIAVVVSSAGSKWMGLARTDGVFTFTIVATALLAWRAWNRGNGWTWFWVMGAIATLAKGPLGLVLAAIGLFAALWERKRTDRVPLRGSHWLGIALFFLIAGGWFALAYHQEGRELVDKMLGKELVGHIAHDQKGRAPGRLLWQPTLFYLSNAAPWSLFAFFSLWRVCKWPAQNTDERRFERFLFCWFAVGLLMFSVSPHQRADLLWPIMPPGALLAGRELARLVSRFKPATIWGATATAVVLGVAGIGYYFFPLRGKQPLVQQTVALKKLAGEWEQATGGRVQLINMDAPMVFQFYLNTLQPQVPPDKAAELLRGSQQVFVAVSDLETLDDARRTNDPPKYRILPPGNEVDSCPMFILSNRPNFL